MNKKAYGQGRNAYCDGKRLADNPYHRATAAMSKNYHEWERGFIETERNDPLKDDDDFQHAGPQYRAR